MKPLYHHTITTDFIAQDNIVLPVIFQMFTSSPLGPSVKELDIRARRELVLQLQAVNHKYRELGGILYITDEEIEQGVRSAYYRDGLVKVVTNKFIPIG